MKFLLSLLFTLSLSSVAFAKPIGNKNFLLAPEAKTSFNNQTDTNFEAVAALPGCSASVIRFEGQKESDKAILMTNDHCLYDQPYKEYMVNKPYKKNINIFDKKRNIISGKFSTEKIIYAVQTDTDVAILELNITYEDLLKEYDIEAFTLDRNGAEVNDEITILSGYWNREFNCKVENIVYRLQEDSWFWTDSLGYLCKTMGGTSGSPVLLTGTRLVVGINNTGNDHGRSCTLQNPCEIDQDGQVTVIKEKSYGQQTKNLYSCLNQDLQFDLNVKGCSLLGGDSWVERK